MQLRYDGPRDCIAVLVGREQIRHFRGQILDYPEAVALELLAEARHQFVRLEDVRRAWRQWCIASARWQERGKHFLQDPQPLPRGALLGSRRALSHALMARHAAEQALQAQRPAFPEICRDLPCGAKTRKGTPCKRRDVYGLGARCRLHGGLSTGPRTTAGKQRAALNGFRPKRKRTP